MLRANHLPHRLTGFLFLLILTGIGLLGWRLWRGPGVNVPAGCIEVASLFGQAICAQDLQTHDADDGYDYNPQTPVPDTDPRERERRKAADSLRNIIWHRALAQRFGAAAIAPSATEVENLRASSSNRMQENYEADVKIVVQINELLARNVYLPIYQRQLHGLLKTVTLSLHLYEARQQAEAARPEAYRFITAAAETKLARQMAVAWRADKLLFDAYGGRLVQARTDFEPVDAYAKFLAYIRRDGHLHIMTPPLRDALEPLEQFIAVEKSAADNPQIAAHYFSDPTWRYAVTDPKTRGDALLQQLQRIPSLSSQPGAGSDPDGMIGKSSRPATP